MAGTAKEKLFELISDMNGSSEDEVPSIVGMEYGGGLDSAYMTLSQRRDSAFAAPDATSAFSSPMSMGGLPTVYRFYGGDVYSNEQLSEAEGISVDERGGFDAFQEPATNRGGLYEPQSVEEVNRQLAAKEREEEENSQAMNQLISMQLRGVVGSEQNEKGLSTSANPVDNRSFNFDFTPSFPAASNPVFISEKDIPTTISKNIKNKPVSQLNNKELDTILYTIKKSLSPRMRDKLDTLVSQNDTVQQVQDKANSLNTGLPTVYRFYGGTVDEVGGSEEYGGFDADLTDEEDSYREAENYFQSTQAGDGGADLPDYAYGITDDRRQDLFGPEGSLDSEDALSSGARSVLLSTLRDMTGNWDDAEEAFKNMTTPEMMNFERAYSGKSSLDGSTGYRYGGPAGTLQDILENRASDQFGLGDIISKDKEEKKFDKFVKETYGDKEVSESFMDKIGLGGLYDTLTDIFSIQSEVSPTTLEGITKQLEGTGATFTPVNSFLAGAMDLALPLAAKGLANLTGGGKTIGTITTADGMSFNLSDAGKLSMNMPMSEYDEGSGATPVKRTVKKKKETKEEKEETPKTGMAALLARRPEPKKRLDTLAGSQDIYKSIYNRPFRTV